MYNLESFYEFVNNHSLALALFIIAIIELVKHFLQKKVEVAFVEQIAKIQEEVKAEFAKQNETIKAELSFSNQHKLNLMAIEREAIFDFNKQYFILNRLMTDLTFISLNNKSNTYFVDLVESLESAFKSYNLSRGHLNLFLFQDMVIQEKLTSLTIKILEYKHNLTSVFKKTNLTISEYNLNNIEIDFKKLNELMDDFQKNANDLHLIHNNQLEIISHLSHKFKA